MSIRLVDTHNATTTTAITIQIARPMTIQVGTTRICINRHCPRPFSTYGTVRSRIFTSVHSDQLAT
jgi:hypothetical protein